MLDGLRLPRTVVTHQLQVERGTGKVRHVQRNQQFFRGNNS